MSGLARVENEHVEEKPFFFLPLLIQPLTHHTPLGLFSPLCPQKKINLWSVFLLFFFLQEIDRGFFFLLEARKDVFIF